MPFFFSKRHSSSSEMTDSSTSTVPGPGYDLPPQLVFTLGKNNTPMYRIYNEPSPKNIMSKSDRRTFDTSKWRIAISAPLRLIFRRKVNVVRSDRFCDEIHAPPQQINNTPDLFADAPHSSVGSLSNLEFNENAVSSLDMGLNEKIEITTDSMNDKGEVNVHTQPDSKNSPHAAPEKHSVVTHGRVEPPQALLNRPGRCIVAGLALLHVSSKETQFQDLLAESCYEGSYLIQVGFNQDMLRSNEGLLQEIYIFLEHEIHPARSEKIAETLAPFPVTIYTPGIIHQYPPSQEKDDMWDSWEIHGIFCPEITDQKTVEISAPSDEGGNPASPAGPSNIGFSTGGSYSDATRHDNFGRSGEPNRGNRKDDRDKDGEDSDEGEGADDRVSVRVETHSVYDDSTREVSVPFSSTLTLSGGTKQSYTRYNTTACVDIRIEDNPDSQSPPSGLNWGGPWLEAKFNLLNAEMRATSKGKASYHLGTSQIRIMASGCDISHLAYSPTIIRVDDGDVKSTTEREGSLGMRATLGAAPNVRLDSSISRTSGEERSQNRWEVISHRLPSDTNETGQRRKTIMWRYVHNDKYYTPETQNDFEPKPSATFGFSRTSSMIPNIEVEVVMDYSWSSPAQTFRDWIADIARSKHKKVPPAFTNFLHQVSVTVDLERVKRRREWVVGLDPEDRYEASEIGMQPEPIVMPLESNVGVSDSEVLLRRALHGHVYLTEGQRKEHRSNPLPWPLDVGDTLAVLGLPTPSPSPTSSVLHGS